MENNILKTEYPKITIITPSFNQGMYIEQTILSVINQNYPNLEYIVIDGGSSDNTVDIIKKYESKISYWVSEKDSGQSNAINKGLQIATGDIINWLNSDDQLADNTLFDIVNLYNSNPNCGVFIGQTEFFSEKTNFGKGGQVVFDLHEMTFAFGQVNQPAMFYKSDSIKKMGLLNESLHYCMDIDWWLKYLLFFNKESIAETEQIWAKFRFHDNSKTLVNPNEFRKEKHRIYKKIFEYYNVSEKSDDDLNLCFSYPNPIVLDLKKALNYYYLWRSDEFMLENEVIEVKRFWKKVNPFLLINSEKRRYLAVLKYILTNLVKRN